VNQLVFVHRIGWTLIHSTWQGVAVALILLIVLRLMRDGSAGARYLVSCAALAAVITMAAATFVAIGPNAAGPIVSERMDGAIVLPSAPLALQQPTTAMDVRATHRDLLGVVVAAWAVGVITIGLWHVGGWLWLCRLRRGAQIHSWDDALARLRGRLRISRGVRLIETIAIDTPAVVGVIRPVIFVPLGVFSGLSPQQVEAILAHELAHVRRHDYLINLMQAAIETLMFYHPAVWWISSRIRFERENCCDDIAANACGDARGYAMALAKIEERRVTDVPRLVTAATGGSLVFRIRRILHLPQVDRANMFRSLAAAVIAISLIAAPLVVMGQQDKTAQQQAAKATTKPADAKDADKKFVKVIVTSNAILRDGKVTDVDQLKKFFDDLPAAERKRTVLEVAAASADITVERFFSVFGQMSEIVKRYDLAYLSDTGIVPRPQPAQVGPILEPRNQYFITGAIARSGAYSVASGAEVNVKQAIAAAGGVTVDVPETTVSVVRRKDGSEIRAMNDVSVKELFAGKANDLVLQGGDVVQITPPPTGEYYIDGQVTRTGVYSLTARKISLKQAIAAAGGLSDGLDDAFICIIRREGRDRESYPLRNVKFSDILSGAHADEYLQPNDLVQVLNKPAEPRKPPATTTKSISTSDLSSPNAAELDDLLQKRRLIEMQIGSLGSKLGDEHPTMRGLRQMLGQIDKMFEQRKAEAQRSASQMSIEQIAQNDPMMREYLKTRDAMDFNLARLARNVGPQNRAYLDAKADLDLQNRRIDDYAKQWRSTMATTQP
jgi:beta-lactamase regulating signal transducer with metallopeptidase domain/protein involved in polysaccharide export with SLBB domain